MKPLNRCINQTKRPKPLASQWDSKEYVHCHDVRHIKYLLALQIVLKRTPGQVDGQTRTQIQKVIRNNQERVGKKKKDSVISSSLHNIWFQAWTIEAKHPIYLLLTVELPQPSYYGFQSFKRFLFLKLISACSWNQSVPSEELCQGIHDCIDESRRSRCGRFQTKHDSFDVTAKNLCNVRCCVVTNCRKAGELSHREFFSSIEGSKPVIVGPRVEARIRAPRLFRSQVRCILKTR